jgi:hypothetical protein
MVVVVVSFESGILLVGTLEMPRIRWLECSTGSFMIYKILKTEGHRFPTDRGGRQMTGSFVEDIQVALVGCGGATQKR